MVNEVMKFITGFDKEVGEAIEKECARQRRNLELIASENIVCLLYTSPSPRDRQKSRMPSSA